MGWCWVVQCGLGCCLWCQRRVILPVFAFLICNRTGLGTWVMINWPGYLGDEQALPGIGKLRWIGTLFGFIGFIGFIT